MKSRAAAALALLLLAAAALRIPALRQADSFLTSDEAVIGLMARHLSEWPVFFWGQDYMGALEAYAAGAAFEMFGESAAVLKSVPLVMFLLFLLAQYDLVRLVTRSRTCAYLSAAILAIGPPVLLSWSVRAMAGYMETLLFGTVALSAAVRYRRSGGSRWLFLLGLSAGTGWWTSQLVACFLLPAFAYAAQDTLRPLLFIRWHQIRLWLGLAPIDNRVPSSVRFPLRVLNWIACAYLCLGVFVLITGGGEVAWGALRIRSTDGWKLIRYAATWYLVEATALFAVLETKATLKLVSGLRPFWLGFLIGWSPVIARFAGDGLEAHAPSLRFSVPELIARLPVLFTEILPLLTGGALPDQAEVQWPVTVVILFALVIAVRGASRSGEAWVVTSVGLVCAALFLVSGQFQDTASYRYLLPLYPTISFMLASRFHQRRRLVTSASLLLVMAIWLIQDFRYLRTFIPQPDSAAVLSWFRERSVGAVYANYWIAYRLDFLGGEDPIFVPYRSQDRYPQYAQAARAAARVGYVFRVGDPLWPSFRRAKVLVEEAVVGRYRLSVVDQRHDRR